MASQASTDTTLRPSARMKRSPSQARRRTAIRWAKRGVMILGGLVIVGAIVYAMLPKPVVVDVARARHATLEVEITEDGQTRVRDRFVISAPITGDLQRIELEAGAAVTAGQVVATIEPSLPILLDARSRREAQARLALAIARQRRAATAIQRAQTARAAAVREADRARQLQQQGAITLSEREREELTEELAIRDLAAAELERAAAAAEVDAARAVLDERRPDQRTGGGIPVKAPAAGQILRVLRDSAGPVATGTPLLELGDPRALEVVVDVLSSDAAQIEEGMKVSIERWGGERALAGRVRLVEPSAFTRISALGVEEQRVRVIVAVDDPPPTLGDAFRVVARIITWRGERVLTIPASAVFRDRGRWAVYLVDEGRARLQPLEIGHRGRLDLEVLGGLAAGDEVIVHPSDSVAPGARVTPRD